ncbi:alpha-L-arabinofuranosidase C-terminal domain-containing protein [Bacteroides sp.]
MKKLVGFLAVYLYLISFPVSAKINAVQNEPDSVFLYSYATAKDEGRSGLKFAWSPDGNKWMNVANGYGYVKCDFGRWGTGKKMLRPRLLQNKIDGRWHCFWEVSESGEVMGAASTSDLLKWGRQSYFPTGEAGKCMPRNAVSTLKKQLSLNGEEESGWVQKVPYTTVEQLIRYAEQKRYRWMQNEECAEQDAVRFAGLKPLEAAIQVHAAETKSISNHLIGIFFEDINYSADGGLYAELIQNRDFEYIPEDREGDRSWNNTHSWSLRGDNAGLSIETAQPIHPNNSHYALLDIRKPGAALQNTGFDGIVVKAGEKYDFSMFSKAIDGKGGKVKISLLDEKSGKELAQTVLSVSSKDWKKQRAVLTASASSAEAVLSVCPQASSRYALDMVSLFPQNTFKGRKNGLRADLAQALADLHPRFMRFPGGCVAHGDGVDNIYDWKGSIGALEARKPMRNLWGYHQTRGLGYFEYFQFCEDIGAEPVPVLAAGVPCQNSATCSHHSEGELGCGGQQGGIPMEEMGAYVQDILDLIEYANGDAKKTVWGKKRAEAGHPKPFNLKYIGIGNEDLITDVFEERFTMIFKAIKEKYPEITVIGTVGPFYEGADYDEGWALATKLGVPMVDEHYYVSPGWLVNNQDFYDRYDRSKPKVYLGEYAAHLPDRPNNIETALAEALYLTSVERNGDVVSMTSYAPLLAKDGHTQWNPDMIYFNNTEVKPTVGYYAQQMYGQNSGDEYLASTVSLDNSQDAVKKRVAVSVVKDSRSGDLIVKLVNLLPVEVASRVNLDGISLTNPSATKTVLSGDPKDKQAKSVSSVIEISGNDFLYTMPAYSFTVIRIQGLSSSEKTYKL